MRTSSASGAAASSVGVMPLKVRGRFITAIAVPVDGTPDETFFAALDALLEQSAHFFANAPLVLDLARARDLESADDFLALLDGLRTRGLSPVGIQHATARQSAGASAAGLVTVQGGRDAPLDGRESRPLPPPGRPSAPTRPAAPAGPPAQTKLVTEPVRSGQRIFAEGGDLVIVAPVGSGAEVIARGNVHVYGPLRGRALAGVNGDTTARIFCQSLEAELIAIAGLYQTSEGLDAGVIRQRVQAFLREDTLCIEALK